MDRETVITHLQIIHTWAEFARERDLQFFTPKHLEDIAQWSSDALVMFEEQKQTYFTLEHDWRLCRKLLNEQEKQIKNRDGSLEKAREEIKWIRGMMKEQEAVVRCKDCKKRNSWECWQYFFGRIKIPDDWFCADGEPKKQT